MKNKKKPKEAKKLKYERLYLGIAYFIHFSLIIAIITSFLTRNWLNLFISAITLFLVFTPKIFSKKTRIVLPLEFETIIVMLIYAGIFLGEVREFYFRFWWSFIAAVSGYFYIAKGYSPLFKNAVERFESKNIELFNALKKRRKN